MKKDYKKQIYGEGRALKSILSWLLKLPVHLYAKILSVKSILPIFLTFRLVLSLCLGLCFQSAFSSAHATVIGAQTANGDGTTTYSYIVDNSDGSFDIAAWSLEFGFSIPDWNQADVFSGGDVAVPNLDWFALPGTPVSGQSAQDFLALTPDGDIAVGQAIIGFSFTSKFLPGLVTYHQFSANGDSQTGSTIGPVNPVPETGGRLEPIAFAALAAVAFASRGDRLAGSSNR